MPATTRSKNAGAREGFRNWPRLPAELRVQILIIYLDDAMPTLGQSALRSIGWADEQMRKLDVLAGLGSQREVVAAADTTLVNLRLAHQNIDAATCRIDNSGQLPLWKLQMSLPASEVRAYEKLGKQRDSLQSIIERLQTKVDRLAAAPKLETP